MKAIGQGGMSRVVVTLPSSCWSGTVFNSSGQISKRRRTIRGIMVMVLVCAPLSVALSRQGGLGANRPTSDGAPHILRQLATIDKRNASLWLSVALSSERSCQLASETIEQLRTPTDRSFPNRPVRTMEQFLERELVFAKEWRQSAAPLPGKSPETDEPEPSLREGRKLPLAAVHTEPVGARAAGRFDAMRLDRR